MRSILSLFRKKNKFKDVCFVHLDQTESTNHYCLRHLDLSGDEALATAKMVVVSTDFQTAGKGQGTNVWESEKGKNLLFSILCHPSWVPLVQQFVLSECIALSIRDVLSEYVSDITIKWPNDIYWKDKKICGILIENRLSGGHIKDCVLGVGLNVNQTVFVGDAPNPVSLAMILGVETERKPLLEAITLRFAHYLNMLENGQYGEVITLYLSYLYRIEGFHTFKDALGTFDAKILSVEEDGHLILRDREGCIRSYMFKEVEFVI